MNEQRPRKYIDTFAPRRSTTTRPVALTPPVQREDSTNSSSHEKATSQHKVQPENELDDLIVSDELKLQKPIIVKQHSPKRFTKLRTPLVALTIIGLLLMGGLATYKAFSTASAVKVVSEHEKVAAPPVLTADNALDAVNKTFNEINDSTDFDQVQLSDKMLGLQP